MSSSIRVMTLDQMSDLSGAGRLLGSKARNRFAL
jgi:hypothetical protein